MNTYTSSSLYSPKHRNTIGSFPSCAQRKPRLTIAGISERLKKSIVFCHQNIIAIPSFLVTHLYETIYPTPSSSFLTPQSFILWFNTFYVVSGRTFRSYISYPKPLTKGFSAWTVTNVTVFSFKVSFDIFSFRDPSFRGNFPWPFMGMEIFWNRFIHC